MSQNFERDLLTRMLIGDLAIAQRMAEIADYAMCRNSLRAAATKLDQIAALSDPVSLTPHFNEVPANPIDIETVS